MGRLIVEDGGSWSGGGSAFLSNISYAMQRMPALSNLSEDVVLIPRNVPANHRKPKTHRFVMAPQNAWPWSLRIGDNLERTKMTALRGATEYFVRKSDGLIRISSAIPVRGKNGQQVSPILHNVLDEGYEAALRASTGTTVPGASGAVVSVGSMNGYRNFERLLDGYAIYRQQGGALPLFLAGTPSNAALVRRLYLKADEIPDVTIRAATLSRPESLAAMRDAAAVILPSLVEASPVAALEAASLCANVLCSDIVGHREILEQATFGLWGGQYFDAVSLLAISRALHQALDSSTLNREPVLGRSAAREDLRLRWATRLSSWVGGRYGRI